MESDTGTANTIQREFGGDSGRSCWIRNEFCNSRDPFSVVFTEGCRGPLWQSGLVGVKTKRKVIPVHVSYRGQPGAGFQRAACAQNADVADHAGVDDGRGHADYRDDAGTGGEPVRGEEN